MDGTVYYFGQPDSLRNARLAVLIAPDGKNIDGLPLTVEGETRFLFQLPQGEDASYRFAPIVDGVPLPLQEDPFPVGTVLVEAQRQGESAHSREIPMAELLGTHPELEPLLREAFSSADRTQSIPGGRTYPGSDQPDSISIYLTANLGDYLKIKEGDLPFTFTHSVTLHFELEGYHAATVSIGGTDFRNRTYQEAAAAPLEVYPFPLAPDLLQTAKAILEEYPAPPQE